MRFAQSLKTIRHELKLSQQALADKMRIAQSTVGMWESGKRTPRLYELNRLAKTLNVNAARLIGQKGIEITKNSIHIAGEKIDTSDLDTSDLQTIVDYINNIKSRKAAKNRPEAAKKSGSGKKILIIDDEQEICETLYSFLAPHNYKVFLAFNGQMGLEYFEDVKPDIVLLDLKMPDIDGDEVLKIIRKVSDVPVVIITAHPQEISKIYLNGHKIEGYIEKPFKLNTVLNTLKHIIGE